MCLTHVKNLMLKQHISRKDRKQKIKDKLIFKKFTKSEFAKDCFTHILAQIEFKEFKLNPQIAFVCKHWLSALNRFTVTNVRIVVKCGDRTFGIKALTKSKSIPDLVYSIYGDDFYDIVVYTSCGFVRSQSWYQHLSKNPIVLFSDRYASSCTCCITNVNNFQCVECGKKYLTCVDGYFYGKEQ